ncbi:phosphopantothenoylcysteine decarboxylase isoform X2 [Lepidochelys kempii]|uniref:phosphopantothenoylcysteine decarboxylase isoform X2 n=1 Tax=Lepidochelys kempii TaxID=8472 RepID=UPI003C6FBDCB
MHTARSSSLPQRRLASHSCRSLAKCKLERRRLLFGFTEMTLGAQPPSLSLAERLRRIRKQSQRTKEDFLRDVTMHSAAEKQELKEWRDSEKRDQKENVARQNKATERQAPRAGGELITESHECGFPHPKVLQPLLVIPDVHDDVIPLLSACFLSPEAAFQCALQFSHLE